jgi:hypothetical protein
MKYRIIEDDTQKKHTTGWASHCTQYFIQIHRVFLWGLWKGWYPHVSRPGTKLESIMYFTTQQSAVRHAKELEAKEIDPTIGTERRVKTIVWNGPDSR